MKNEYHLSLGSNLGNRLDNLWQACVELTKAGVAITSMSSVYRSEPWGMDENTPEFYNLVIKCVSDLNEIELLMLVQDIEMRLGRQKKSDFDKYYNREIDIDILLKGDEIIAQKNLIIPHKQLKYRAFVLIPLLEIEPELMFPGSGEKISDIIHSCKDLKTVNKLSSLGTNETE